MSMMTRRGLLTPKKGLPDIYQKVEYLWSQNGVPWIDTGYAVTTPDFKIEFKFNRTGSTATSTWGVDFSSNPREMHGHFYQSNVYYGNNKRACGYDIGTDKEIEGYVRFSDIYLNASGKEVQDVEYQLNDYHNIITNDGQGLFTGSQHNDYFFGVNGSREEISCSHRCAEKIYYFRYYDNTGKLAREFIPCHRKSDNKPGMYETVLGTFHVNQNSTGEFAVGPDI